MARISHTKLISNPIFLVLVGEGDLHNKELSCMVRSSSFERYEQIVDLAATVSKNQSGLDYCRYRFHVFATDELEDSYVTNDPYIYAIINSSIFVFTSLIFILYDAIVHRRQNKVMGVAKRTNDIVTEIFPKQVRDRMFERAQEQNATASNTKGFLAQPTKTQMQNFLSDDLPPEIFGSEPIADLFPHCVSQPSCFNTSVFLIGHSHNFLTLACR